MIVYQFNNWKLNWCQRCTASLRRHQCLTPINYLWVKVLNWLLRCPSRIEALRFLVVMAKNEQTSFWTTLFSIYGVSLSNVRVLMWIPESDFPTHTSAHAHLLSEPVIVGYCSRCLAACYWWCSQSLKTGTGSGAADNSTRDSLSQAATHWTRSTILSN